MADDLKKHTQDQLQIRLYGALLSTDILKKHRGLIHDGIFSTNTSRRCAHTTLRLFDKLGHMPSVDTLLTEVAIEHEDHGAQCRAFVMNATEIDKEELIRIYGPELLQLIESCHMQTCLSTALDRLASGDKAGARTAISKSNVTTASLDQCSYLTTDPTDRYRPGNLQGRGKKWPTGYPTMDQILSGGPAVCEVHGFVGPTGCGKTRTLLNLLVNAAYFGAHSVYVSLEIQRDAAAARIDSILTGMPPEKLRTPHGQARLAHAQRVMAERGGDIWIVKFVPHSMDVNQVGHYLRAMERRPDVVALDYMELLSPVTLSGSGNYWEDQARMYSQFHGIVEELHAVGWLATQPTKGQTEGVDRLGQVSGSGHKIDGMDSFWSIHITGEQLTSEGRFGLLNLKNRWGPARKMVRMIVDIGDGNSYMRVSEDEIDEDKGDA